jgi:hypothetical protein
MSLRTATLIALIGIMVQSIFSILINFGVIEITSTVMSKIYFIAYLVFGNGSILLFLAVLYSKQKKTGGE